MNRDQCIERLREHSRPIASFAEDITVLLKVKNEAIVVSTSRGAIESVDVKSAEDVRIACFDFDTWSTAFDLLVGHIDLASVFLNGRIRSNGYLTLIFPIMSIFQHQRGSVAPE
ncbi:MAG: hypothetical protein F4X44_05205 [Gammaproteobacteria bacterium]|nr:hypothetical protein [Gammaproteobacteria bacterium]MYD79990.1 hypothetical protein [Gammaproteobacteria bacterium]